MTPPKHSVWPLSTLKHKLERGESPFHIFLDTASMRVEYLEYPAGHVDSQQPHEWDELYYIISGSSDFTADGVTRPVAAGDSIFVAAKIPHIFHGITQALSVIVVFSKQEPKL